MPADSPAGVTRGGVGAQAEQPVGRGTLQDPEKKVHIRDTMEIDRDGHMVAKIKKALITPLRELEAAAQDLLAAGEAG